jgi:hypothetical protein
MYAGTVILLLQQIIDLKGFNVHIEFILNLRTRWEWSTSRSGGFTPGERTPDLDTVAKRQKKSIHNPCQ